MTTAERLNRTEPKSRWSPIRLGAIYCSPACGGRCTWQAFQQATKDAAALAEELGPGWSGEVSENLGWHFRASHESGCIQVHQTMGTYSAYLNEKGRMPGGRWVTAGGSDPREVVRSAIAQARRELEAIQAVLDATESQEAPCKP